MQYVPDSIMCVCILYVFCIYFVCWVPNPSPIKKQLRPQGPGTRARSCFLVGLGFGTQNTKSIQNTYKTNTHITGSGTYCIYSTFCLHCICSYFACPGICVLYLLCIFNYVRKPHHSIASGTCKV